MEKAWRYVLSPEGKSWQWFYSFLSRDPCEGLVIGGTYSHLSFCKGTKMGYLAVGFSLRKTRLLSVGPDCSFTLVNVLLSACSLAFYR